MEISEDDQRAEKELDEWLMEVRLSMGQSYDDYHEDYAQLQTKAFERNPTQ